MRLGHIHLKVADLTAAERFYCDILGLKVEERVGDTFVFLTFGEAHHELALQEVRGAAGSSPVADGGSNAPGLYHSAFEVGSEEELLSVLDRLTAHAIPYSLVDHLISWAAYTTDPSGNGVEVYLDRRNAPGGARSWNGRSARLVESAIRRKARP